MKAFEHTRYGTIPAVYQPPLDDDVVECARLIAADMIANGSGDYLARAADLRPLYRVVRIAMGRHVTPTDFTSVADDESISRGIVNALNDALSTRGVPTTN